MPLILDVHSSRKLLRTQTWLHANLNLYYPVVWSYDLDVCAEQHFFPVAINNVYHVLNFALSSLFTGNGVVKNHDSWRLRNAAAMTSDSNCQTPDVLHSRHIPHQWPWLKSTTLLDICLEFRTFDFLYIWFTYSIYINIYRYSMAWQREVEKSNPIPWNSQGKLEQSQQKHQKKSKQYCCATAFSSKPTALICIARILPQGICADRLLIFYPTTLGKVLPGLDEDLCPTPMIF